jgi:hypothetical protein
MDDELYPDGVPLYENSPSWRWDLVKALLHEGRRPGRSMDKHVQNAFRFLSRWKKSTEVDRYLLKRDYPTLFSAYLLYANPHSERWLVEAGLLSEATFEDIGKYTAHKAKVVELYGEMFYDIREKREAKGYIANRVLIPAAQRGMDGRDFDCFLKMLAYFAGWKVMTDFIADGDMSDETRQFLSTNFMDSMLKLGYQATHRLDVNNYNAMAVIEQCVKLRELEQARHGSLTHAESWAIMESLLKKCATVPRTEAPQLSAVEPRVLENTGDRKILTYGDPIPVMAGANNGEDEQAGRSADPAGAGGDGGSG